MITDEFVVKLIRTIISFLTGYLVANGVVTAQQKDLTTTFLYDVLGILILFLISFIEHQLAIKKDVVLEKALQFIEDMQPLLVNPSNPASAVPTAETQVTSPIDKPQ